MIATPLSEPDPDTYPCGHPRTPENSVADRQSNHTYRRCRTCNRERCARAHTAKLAASPRRSLVPPGSLCGRCGLDAAGGTLAWREVIDGLAQHAVCRRCADAQKGRIAVLKALYGEAWGHAQSDWHDRVSLELLG